jgi:hypothetical protein
MIEGRKLNGDENNNKFCCENSVFGANYQNKDMS